jgi:putative sterol carrier protein
VEEIMAGQQRTVEEDGVGPITVSALADEVTVERGRVGNTDVTLHVTADQYMRLLAGRLPLRAALDTDAVTVDGDRTRAENLNRLFAGVGG